MEYEIIFRSKLTTASTRCYAATVEQARTLVMHHLNAGRYDSGAVFGPEGGQAIFRATRWYSPHFAAVIDNPVMEPARRVPAGVNPYEFAAQVGKARKLAETMFRFGIDASDALLMDDGMWALAAIAAGVKTPSNVTRMMTIENLSWMAGVAA